MPGTITERLRTVRVGSKEYIRALRDDALSEANAFFRRGLVGVRRYWLDKARKHTKLLKLMAKNEAWEKEHGNKVS